MQDDEPRENDTDRRTSVRRRHLLALAGGTALVGGCLGEGDTPAPEATPDTPTDSPSEMDGTATSASDGEWTPIAERDVETESPGATIQVSDYGAESDTGEDVTDGVLDAVAAASKEGATVVFEEGEYLLGAGRDGTSVRETPPLFDLEGYTDLTFEGNGAVLKPVNWGITFRPIQCANLTVRDLTVDWERDLPMSEGHVVAETADYVDMELRADFAPREGLPVNSYYFWDEQGGEVQNPLYHPGTETTVPEDGILRCPKGDDTPAELTVEDEPVAQGDALIIRHASYGGTGMRSYECEGITFQNVMFHSNPGMGCYLKHTADVTAEGLGFERTDDHWFGLAADGFHLKNAYGDYELRDISVKSSGDDWLALPIFRHDIESIDGAAVETTSGLMVKNDLLYHGFREGDTVAIATSPNLLEPAFTATVADSGHTIEDDRGHAAVGGITVELDEAPPDGITDADTVQLYHQEHLPDSLLVDNATIGPVRGGTRLRSPNLTIQNSTLERAGSLWFHAQPRGAVPSNGTIRTTEVRPTTRILVGAGENMTLENNTLVGSTESHPAIEVTTNGVSIANNTFENVAAADRYGIRAPDCSTVTIDGEDACDR
jgi:hypothetical protein